MKKPVWTLNCIALFLFTAVSQAAGFASLDVPISELTDAFIKDKTFAGVQVAVRHQNREIFNKGFGFANLEKKIPFDQDTIVALGSNTKTFTSIAVQLLASQNKLNLDEPVEGYFPISTFKNSGITIRHLLCHTSGMPNIYDPENYGVVNHFSLRKFSNLVDNFSKPSLPDEKYQYNNTGYLFLGLLVEKVSGQSIGDFYREHIIAPLGLQNTLYLGDTFHPLKMASSYDEDFTPYNATKQYYTEYRIAHGSGALGGTLQDYMLWFQSILQGKLLPHKNLKAMKQPCTLKDGTNTQYGLGLKVKQVNGYLAYSHGGAINGFSSDAYYFPEQDLTIGFAANTWTNPTEYRDKLIELVLSLKQKHQ